MIVVIDHFDSFVETLARYLREAGEEVVTIRQNAPLDAVLAHQPKALILSPGPGTPDETGISLELLAACPADMPILGVCLGHQTLAQAYGGRVGRAREPMHGKASAIHHNGDGLFAGLPRPMQAGRYHALIVEKLPDCLRATAQSSMGEIMAFAHVSRPVFGVQFHPESILTPHGRRLIDNFLGQMRPRQPAPEAV